MTKKILKKKRGFTLIELMIVVGVVGILAVIALPRYGDMLEKANHGATMGNIAAIRSAIGIYYGAYSVMPSDISSGNSLFEYIIGNVLPGVKARYPFIHSPYGDGVYTGVSVPDTSGSGWYYDNSRGYVYINSIEIDVYGKSYTIY